MVSVTGKSVDSQYSLKLNGNDVKIFINSSLEKQYLIVYISNRINLD
jgi:hypothetical protein